MVFPDRFLFYVNKYKNNDEYDEWREWKMKSIFPKRKRKKLSISLKFICNLVHVESGDDTFYWSTLSA